MRSLSDFVYKVLLAIANVFFDADNGNFKEGTTTVLAPTSLATGLSRIIAQRAGNLTSRGTCCITKAKGRLRL